MRTQRKSETKVFAGISSSKDLGLNKFFSLPDIRAANFIRKMKHCRMKLCRSNNIRNYRNPSILHTKTFTYPPVLTR